MATADRRAIDSVADRLFTQPYEFNFFQAVRLLGAIAPDRRSLRREHGKKDPLPCEEIVRFRTHNSLVFPSTSIYEIKPGARIGERPVPAEMAIAFMGFTGRQGVLPFHYTEFVIDRIAQQDTVAADFFDMFLHRLVSLFYCTWEKHSVAVQYEQPQPELDRVSNIAQYVLDLAGLGEPSVRAATGLEPQALIFYGGLLAQQPRSAVALEGLLRDFFQVDIRIDPFAGRWIDLEKLDQTDFLQNALSNRLGGGASLGDAVWCPQAKIRLHIGPLTRRQYEAFLPPGPERKGGTALPLLKAWVNLFLDHTLEFEVQLCLQKAEVPEFYLWDEWNTAIHPPPERGEPIAPALGLTTWLKTEEFTQDAQDLVLQG